jgi:hypothetical protein
MDRQQTQEASIVHCLKSRCDRDATGGYEGTRWTSDVPDGCLSRLQDFLRSEKWYANRGIPYRRGYLLHVSISPDLTTLCADSMCIGYTWQWKVQSYSRYCGRVGFGCIRCIVICKLGQ